MKCLQNRLLATQSAVQAMSDKEVLAESSMEQRPPPTQYTPQPHMQGFWSPLDPGRNQRSYSDDELGEDLIDFELLSVQEDNSDHVRCLFIDDKAEDSDRSESILDNCYTSEVFSFENPPDAPRKKTKKQVRLKSGQEQHIK